MKDTKYEDLNKTLAAVGKAVFVNFYYDFKDFSISKDELAKKILSENPGSKSDSQNFRIPRARHIFESGQEKEALRIIIESKRVDKKAIEKAKHVYLYGVAYSHLLCKYLQYEGDLFQKDMLVLDENESTIELKEDDLLLVIGIEEDALSKQSSRYLRKLLRSQGRKLLISTQMIDQKMLNYFHETLLLPIDHLEMKERRIMFHCLIDMMMSR